MTVRSLTEIELGTRLSVFKVRMPVSGNIVCGFWRASLFESEIVWIKSPFLNLIF